MVPLSMTLSDKDVTWISRSRHFVKSNYYCTRGKVPNIWNGTMFGELEWPLRAHCTSLIKWLTWWLTIWLIVDALQEMLTLS